MKTYKVLCTNLISPFKNFEFELGKEYTCENFDQDTTKDCSFGFYATPKIEGCLYTNLSGGKVIFQCETSGKCVEFDRFKIRWEKIKIIRQVQEQEIRSLAKEEGRERGYDIEHALFPVNPFLITPPKISENELLILKNWDSVRASVEASVEASVWASVWASVAASVWVSVGASVWDSVGDSVWASVRASVRASVAASVWVSVGASVRDSVMGSVGDSVWAYYSSLFPSIHKENKLQPSIDLWNLGLVPSFDGKTWRLHGGEKAKILFEISKSDLEKYEI